MTQLAQLGAVLTLIALDASTPPMQTALPTGTPVWSLVGDASVATLTPAADGLSAQIVGGTAAGSVTVTVTLDGFTKSDTFEFAGVVAAPPPAPVPGPAASIDWTVTPIAAPAPVATA